MKNKTIINTLLIVMAMAIAFIIVRDFVTNKKGKDIENPYAFDVSEYTKVNPSEILYNEVKTIQLTAEYPTGIDVSENGIFVAAKGLVSQINENGEELSSFEIDSTATCIKLSPTGEIYLGLKNKVVAYNSDGELLTSWESFGPRSVITSIIPTTDKIFVADAGNRVVYQCSKEGEIILRIGEKDDDKAVPGYVIPSPYFDIALNEEGYLWAVNPGRHSLENYTAEGALRSSWTQSSVKTEGFSGCCNPAHMTIMDDNTFVTSEKGIVRVKIYDQHGEYQGVVAAPNQFDEASPAPDVAVDDNGKIFLLDFNRNQVRIFEAKKNG
ncbi:hypothetical protein ACUNWD_15645 [Sunxiuqinia sp. A32]|uniref:hypothetical protein n=1 Tax=Sunxiuqinia sp. A32 TaxID=3461496 RepID=UPI00404591C3